MCNSLTIVIPNRNRDLKTVRRSLDSIVPQLTLATRLVIVDYGSQLPYQLELEKLVNSIDQVELILCPTQGQLWNKSRCINIVLRSCTTTHFMVSDMDMIWHPRFLEYHMQTLSHGESVYFTVGILTQQETAADKSFENYAIKFQTNEEATGISIFPTAHLKSINGFDEFYHGWGSEDTDVHVRLKNAGYEVHFRKSVTYFKHQWHEKFYRSIKSSYPFNTLQERVNASYLSQSIKLKKIKSNIKYDMGVKPLKIESSSREIITISSAENEVKGILHYFLDQKGIYNLQVDCAYHFSVRNKIKRQIKNALPKYLSLEQVNNLILEWIITNARNSSYYYRVKGKFILLKIDLP